MQANKRRRTSGRASGPHDSQIGSSQADADHEMAAAEQSDHDSEVSVSIGDNPLALIDANVEKLINDVKDMIEVARAWQLDDPMLRPVQAEAQDIILELLLLQTKIEAMHECSDPFPEETSTAKQFTDRFFNVYHRYTKVLFC